METIGEFSFEPICDKYGEEMKNKSASSKAYTVDVMVHPSNCALPSSFKKYAQKIRDFPVYPNDTWVITFPRSGTTWTQEMVWLLVNNLDYPKAKSIPQDARFPFLEWEVITPNFAPNETIEMVANIQRPRCIKSHLPVDLLPKGLWTVKPKIIYVARDPRDVVISYYHHYRYFNAFTGTLEEFAEAFLADRVRYAPFWSNVLDFYKLKNEPNVLFNTYEEMKKNLSGVIKKTADFLNINVSDDDVERLKEHLSFQNMKGNSACNNMESRIKFKKELNKEDDENLNFIRKGESGNWRKILSKNLIDEFDRWDKKHLNGTGFDKYPWS